METNSAAISESQGRDYVATALAYAREAAADRRGRIYGKLIRLAARRFLADLKRAAKKRAPFRFDPWHANNACDFIEKLPHVEGVWPTPDLRLDPSQVFFVVQLFGFRSLDGGRRFTSALFAVARKNAKSTLAAAIMLYCLCCEDEPGAQLISAATTGDQARMIWNVAAKMVKRTAELREAFGLHAWANSISRDEAESNFKPINAKASTQDGLNPSHTAIDEIHAHKTADLINVLESAAGARRWPLWLFTTTEGYITAGPWSELRHFARQLLEGVLPLADTDHYLAIFYALDDSDDDFSEATWIKANPLLRSNPVLLTQLRRLASEAKRMPTKLAEFRVKRLNRQASSAGAEIDLRKWRRGEGGVDLAMLRAHPCYAGLDLSSTMDLASWRLVWHIAGHWYTWGRRWVPMEGVQSRTERGSNAYALWADAGHIEMCEGDANDYDLIERRIREDCATFQVQQIAFDSWNAQDISNRLLKDGFPLVAFIQGPKSYHPAIQEVERAYLGRRFHYGDDPVLTWCASNLVTRKDANLNKAPDKKRSPEKIDDMCALYMGTGICLAQPESFDFEAARDAVVVRH